jgi:branched-chain amino acid transport system substrate-binding protein
MRARFGLSFVCVLALTVCCFSGALAAPAAPPSILIGAPLPLSGRLSSLGGQSKAGYDMAVEDINKSGGVFVKEFGKKIPLELVVQDSESDQVKVQTRMEWLFSAKKVVAYVGDGLLVNGQGVAERNKVPLLAIAALHTTPHERGLKYFFSPFPKTTDVSKFVCDLLDSIPKEKRPKTMAIFQENTEAGVLMSEELKKEAPKRGYKIVVYEKYPIQGKDFSSAITAAKNAGAEVLFTNPIAPDGMTIMRQLKELDYNPKAIFVIRGGDDLTWGKTLGPLGDYALLSGPGWHHSVKSPLNDKINAAHQAKFGRPADLLVGCAYASIQIVANAVEKAGTLDTTKIRDAIAATDLNTAIGRIRFRPNGTLIDPQPVMIQWLGGAQKVVWPKELRETPFVYPIPTWQERQ